MSNSCAPIELEAPRRRSRSEVASRDVIRHTQVGVVRAKDVHRLMWEFADTRAARKTWGRQQEEGTNEYVRAVDQGIIIGRPRQDIDMSYRVFISGDLVFCANAKSRLRERLDDVVSFIVHAEGEVIHSLLRRMQDRGVNQVRLRTALESLIEKANVVRQGSEFIQNAIRLDVRGRTDAALDIIYDGFDELFREDRIDEADCAIRDINPEQLSDSLLVGILTATLPAKSRLPYRASFYQEAERLLTERGSMEPGLLAGLEP